MIADPPAVAAPPQTANHFAPVSLLLSFIFPVGIFLSLFSFAISSYLPYAPVLDVLNPVATLVFFAGVPCAIAAIVTGHLGVARAHRLPPDQARRAMAITGLVIGYVSIALAVLALMLFTYLLLLALSSL